MEYELHDLCKLVPLCTEAEYEVLEEDIRQNGLLTPIVLFEGKILDGRSRYAACLAVGTEPRFEEYSGKDAMSFVHALNISRRHLTESQRALTAAKLLDYGKIHGLTQEKLSRIMNVSSSSIRYAGKVLQGGDAAAVEAGTKSVYGAMKEMQIKKEDAPQRVVEEEEESEDELKKRVLGKAIPRHAKVLRELLDMLCQLTGGGIEYFEAVSSVKRILENKE